MSFFLFPREGIGNELLFELSSEDDSSELDSTFFCFFLNFSGTIASFLMEVLYASFHQSSFQLVGPPSVFFPRPKFYYLLCTWTQSLCPCWFLPNPLPSFHPILTMRFLAYSLSNLIFETPELCNNLSLYLLAINNDYYCIIRKE